MGKLVTLVVLLGTLLLGARSCSKLQLEERARAYQSALASRGLAAQSGMDSVPSEALIRERAEALAREYELSVSGVQASRTDGASPVGAGAMAADALGEIAGRAGVDEEGNVVPGAPLRLRSTVVEVRAHVRGEGFLCSFERDVSATASFGYALR